MWCTGAQAWDHEDGDLSDHVLSCPPAMCMLFNCPGHETIRKGLSGCGIDTVNAPVNTEFSLQFTVSDFSNPAATVTVERLITVVSPCEQGTLYCHDLAWPAHATGTHACGTTDCLSRVAILALEPPETVQTAPSVKFSTAVPMSAIVTAPAGNDPLSTSAYDEMGISISQECFFLYIRWHFACV